VSIGDDVRIMDGSFVAEGAVIGNKTLLGAGVVMSGHRMPDLHDYKYTENRAPIIDGACLIGSGANLLPGIRIGEGAIIAAGAIVAESVPPRWKAVGHKATVSFIAPRKPVDHHPV
jgi:acetyltransferase-like isoleucine patch superfamily enzyme